MNVIPILCNDPATYATGCIHKLHATAWPRTIVQPSDCGLIGSRGEDSHSLIEPMAMFWLSCCTDMKVYFDLSFFRVVARRHFHNVWPRFLVGLLFASLDGRIAELSSIIKNLILQSVSQQSACTMLRAPLLSMTETVIESQNIRQSRG